MDKKKQTRSKTRDTKRIKSTSKETNSKRSPSGYQLFCKDAREKRKGVKLTFKELGELWGDCTEAEKAKWNEIALKKKNKMQESEDESMEEKKDKDKKNEKKSNIRQPKNDEKDKKRSGTNKNNKKKQEEEEEEDEEEDEE